MFASLCDSETQNSVLGAVLNASGRL